MQIITDDLPCIGFSMTSLLTRTCFSLAAAAVLLASSAEVRAANSLVVTAQAFPDGTLLYTPEINGVDTSACGKQTVGAAPEIIVNGVTYEFLFWNINARPWVKTSVAFQPVCGAANSAVAWYWPICTVSTQCPGTATVDNVAAFSLNDNKVIPATPIKSVIGGAWSAGSTVVTPPADIEALPKIPPYGVFVGWEVLPGPLSWNPDIDLTTPGQFALAFYGIPEPDPCQSIRNEINTDSYCGGDGLSPAACAALLKSLGDELKKCEATYGE